jgi:hypothetical protein
MRIPAMALTILLSVFFASTSNQATASDLPSNLGEQTLWDGPPPSFCVSLSGGGIRSGAVSLGVLQALTVLKLGIVPTAEAQYPAAVREFWTVQKGIWQVTIGCTGNRLKKRCTFPQQATVTQNFSRDEFRAYRCLGYQMTREFLSSSLAQGLTQSATAKWPDSSCESSIPKACNNWKET